MKFDLGGVWRLKDSQNSFDIEARVPGSVCSNLIHAGVLNDPKVMDFEADARSACEKDYIFERDFAWDTRKKYRHIKLILEGIDTIGKIYLNDILIGRTENMHTTYIFDISKALKHGENKIVIRLFSPIRYIEKRQKEDEIFCPYPFAIHGYAHMRKSHCMFGWDWGPKIPDLGIFRDIWIAAYDVTLIQYLHIVQKTTPEKSEIEVSPELFTQVEVRYSAEILRDGNVVDRADGMIGGDKSRLIVPAPELWYPNGMGAQPLYDICVRLFDADGREIDKKSLSIGLRQLRIRKEPDVYGESFEIEVNGSSLFAMGGNLIPPDIFPEDVTQKRLENIVRACAESNFNCFRVWGGGFYPSDEFYDLCDKYGILVWQDLMFGCANYHYSEEFERVITEEIVCNLKRIRSRSCLLLLCGDNEIEEAQSWRENPAGMRAKADYSILFGYIIPKLVKRYAPDVFYWPSSPSSGGRFDDPQDENRGDRHYWQEWIEKEPFEKMKAHYSRFCSEFGFESYTSLRTMRKYIEEEALFANSKTMLNRQKHPDSEDAIVRYLFQNHKMPADFERMVYLSQAMQADSVKTVVEHFRRNRGRCMGALYWQINDVWPCTSFSSIDYEGRRKALHANAKRFFDPLLLSAEQEGSRVRFTIINERTQPFFGKIHWTLCDGDCNVLLENYVSVEVEGKQAQMCCCAETADFVNREDLVLFYSLIAQSGEEYSEESMIFCKPKDFRFRSPQIQCKISQDGREFIIRCNTYVRGLFIEFESADTVVSKNYLDCFKGKEYRLSLRTREKPEELKKNMKLFYLN